MTLLVVGEALVDLIVSPDGGLEAVPGGGPFNLARTAARLGVDFIAIASHGRSGLSRALMGSVADRLLRATRKPVLVLRPG